MLRTFSYHIKDSGSRALLVALAHKVNFVWNFCNQTQLQALRWHRTWPSGFDLNNLTAGASRALGLHSQTLQAIGEQYAEKRNTARKPRLRWRGRRSLGWVPFKASGVKVEEDRVTYYGHTFHFWRSRPLGGKLKTGSFSQDARGRWYVNFQCEVTPGEATLSRRAVGIDLGLKSLASLSSGEKIEAPRFYRDLEPALAAMQRARKKRRVAALHAKIANRRKAFLHKLSTRLVSEYGFIFVGDVSASGLAKTRMAKSVLDAGWSVFRTMLEYKAIARRVRFEVVNEAYTSRTCSSCLARSGPQGIAGLGIREWVCSDCGARHDRDLNAARVILALGHQRLAGGIPVL
jgi:putative transposase